MTSRHQARYRRSPGSRAQHCHSHSKPPSREAQPANYHETCDASGVTGAPSYAYATLMPVGIQSEYLTSSSRTGPRMFGSAETAKLDDPHARAVVAS
jgi:hypothetical protein